MHNTVSRNHRLHTYPTITFHPHTPSDRAREKKMISVLFTYLTEGTQAALSLLEDPSFPEILTRLYPPQHHLPRERLDIWMNRDFPKSLKRLTIYLLIQNLLSI